MMNAPIRKVSVFMAILFAALMVNITVMSVARTDDLNADTRNRRVRDAEFSQDRGAILVGNTPIAGTKPSSGRFQFQREYPSGAKYAAVTGYYSYDFARAGLEREYNAELAGTDSTQAFNRFLDLISGRKPSGATLQTTLNPKAQQAAIDAMGDKRGAVVAMDYTTGAVLAMASTPTYDPNRLASHNLKEEQAAWQELLKAPGEPLKNKAATEIYPPGSTFKLVVAAAALADGLRPDSKVESPAALPLPGSSRALTNSTDCGGTTTTLQRALATSCNTAFAQIGMNLGADKLRAQAKAFGFDESPGIDLPAATSKFPAKPDQAQLALSSIGQFEVAASPLQMAMVAGAIANDGALMQPYLVSEVRAPDLTILSSHRPNEKSRPMEAANAALLKQMMVETVNNGTGRSARIDGLTVGGKTGTAQTAPDRPPYAWFVGYADDPHVVVAAFIESADVERNDIAGGRLAGPVVKAVIEAIR